MQQQLVLKNSITDITTKKINIILRCLDSRYDRYGNLTKWKKKNNLLECVEITHAGIAANFTTNMCSQRIIMGHISTPIRKHKKYYPEEKLRIKIHVIPHKDCFIYDEMHAEKFAELFGCISPFDSIDVAQMEKTIQISDIIKAIKIIKDNVKINFFDMDIEMDFEITWGEFLDPEGKKIYFEKISLET